MQPSLLKQGIPIPALCGAATGGNLLPVTSPGLTGEALGESAPFPL